MYICLGAMQRGFKAGCRPILGLDGCHLKSAYGGQLLSAVGLDPNNTTYVVAYAMVEMESKDSWDWFLRLLSKDLNITGEGNGFTFISDKQKGLLPACEEVLPLADHRFCVRHLWTNFNKLFPGKVMKDQLWAIAKSTTMAYYWKELVLMKQMDPGAYDWLTGMSTSFWCFLILDETLRTGVELTLATF
ncbi:putative transposase, mutator type, MULE transposase domain-containing protein [Rosa chinensis]|uniref:Putative transposase, mutator type, MULE transposase domain-containing protein n=1 Tax=Rosa chinensis TaxID=74649 RepID=A0A2P6QR57_ROSCH|nr:putative transposase, mutator type, MULE transposase domain-containing protein [Rosa chinensis]